MTIPVHLQDQLAAKHEEALTMVLTKMDAKVAVLLVVTDEGLMVQSAINAAKCAPGTADGWYTAGNVVAQRMYELLQEVSEQ